MMPDEQHPDPMHYRKLSHEELVRLAYQMLDDQNVWRQRWREEQARRIAIEKLLDLPIG